MPSFSAVENDGTWSRIASLMKARSWRISDLADASGVKQPTISKWKHGYQEPDRDSLLKIAGAFGVSVDQLEGVHKMPALKVAVGPLSAKEGRLIDLYRGDDERVRKLLDVIVEQFGEDKK